MTRSSPNPSNAILTEKFLFEEIVTKGKSRTQIANEIGVCEKLVRNRAKQFGLYVRANRCLDGILTADVLRDMYVVRQMSIQAISIELDIRSNKNVKRALIQHEIPLRKYDAVEYARKHFGTGFKDITGNFWSRINCNARTRCLEFSISLEYAWDVWLSQNGKCNLSGVSLRLESVSERKAGIKRTASLDRIDSDKGYIEGNIQWVHKDLNMMKHCMDEATFLEWCEKIVLHRCLVKT